MRCSNPESPSTGWLAPPPDPEDSDAPALRRAEASLPGRGRTIPPSLLHFASPKPAACVPHLGRFLPRSPIMRRHCLDREDDTAPGKPQPRHKKGLHSTARLDDRLNPKRPFLPQGAIPTAHAAGVPRAVTCTSQRFALASAECPVPITYPACHCGTATALELVQAIT
jgi:hypothetical protein